MTARFHWDPDTYLETIRVEVPGFDQLQEAAIEAIPFAPEQVLDLGIGTGETSRRLLEAYPEARITGIDSSSEMVFRARQHGWEEVRLGRIEDPLPDGPWDLVIAVLSVHLLNDEQKQVLFRRVREQSRALVLGDIVKHEPQRSRIDPLFDYIDTAEELADWSAGEVTWRADDLAVVRATYS